MYTSESLKPLNVDFADVNKLRILRRHFSWIICVVPMKEAGGSEPEKEMG